MRSASQLSMPRVRPVLPQPRGPVSAFVLEHLARPVHRMGPAPAAEDDPLDGEDSNLALYCCYELHYRGFDGVDDDWEWEPLLLALRRRLEQRFEQRLAEVTVPVCSVGPIASRLEEIAAAGSGPSLSEYMAEHGSLEQLREFAIHRSAYQLKEADPHTWALPRLGGRPKAAMVTIQADEYGQGVAKDMHAELFAGTLRELGLDDTYGAYLDRLPGVTLATVNLVSLFGLHRRWLGALIGHLALFEMSSVEPMGRYSVALRRHGLGPWARLFYDTHVVADAHHQFVAAHDLAGGLVAQQPHLADDVCYGAQALMVVEHRFTRHLLDAWANHRSSLFPL